MAFPSANYGHLQGSQIVAEVFLKQILLGNILTVLLNVLLPLFT